MSVYAVDSEKQALRATGVISPVMQWVEDPETKRRKPSNAQDYDDNGVPLWAVEVMYLKEEWGRRTTVVSQVQVPAPSEPQLEESKPVPFEGLTVSVRVQKGTTNLVESWRAEGIKGMHARAEKAAA